MDGGNERMRVHALLGLKKATKGCDSGLLLTGVLMWP